MNNILKKLVRSFSVFILCFTQYALAESNPILDNELTQFKQEFSGNLLQVRNAVNKLEWTGISDPALYDIIAERLEKNYTDTTPTGQELNSWLVKSLALSGQEKYRASFRLIFGTPSLKVLNKHALVAAKRLVEFQKFNPIISANTSTVTTLDELNRTRLLNMLKSNDGALEGAAAHKVNYMYTNDAQMVGAVHDVLRTSYRQKDKVMAIHWMCRTVGESGLEEFKPTFEMIIKDQLAPEKVRSYAKKYIVFL